MRIFCVFLIFPVLLVPARGDTVTVSAAISLKESLTEIGKTYETNTGDHVTFNFDASGKLAAQIMQGAPVDAFISADNQQMDKLVTGGKIVTSSRHILATNALVLITSPAEKTPPKSFADLANGGNQKIAIGEPKTVPAGHYAMQVLKALKVDQAIAPRLVLGDSVRQVLSYVKQDQVWAGIVYATDAKQAGDTVKVVCAAESSMHDKIEYPGAVITSSAHADAAEKFLDYLVSDPAKTVLIAHGFTIPLLIPTTRPSP